MSMYFFFNKLFAGSTFSKFDSYRPVSRQSEVDEALFTSYSSEYTLYLHCLDNDFCSAWKQLSKDTKYDLINVKGVMRI